MCGTKRHTKTEIRSKMSELICGRIAAGENYNLTRDSQYMENFSDKEIKMVVIEIHFKYDITENCEKFLNAVQEQIGQYGIMIKARVG